MQAMQQQQQQPPAAQQQTVQTTQQTVQTTAEVLDAAAEYWKRRHTALWLTVALLCLSMVALAVGLASATRTDNVPVAGYYPGITLSFGAFLGIVGIHLLENRRPMLTAAIIFISIGVIASFFCAIIDGIIAAEFIPEGYKISVNFLETLVSKTLDTRPLLQDGCDYYTSGSGYAFDNYYTEVTCRSLDHTCKLKVRSNTCYCCYLYSCENQNYQYYEFTGVSGCWDVIHLHRLLWASVVLNVLGVFLGIITAAILGAYKDLKPVTQSQMCPSPAPPPHILYNPNQHMTSYTGYCPSGQALPAYPNYQIPMQHHNYPQLSSTPQQVLLEGGLTSTTCLSDESQTQPPSHAPTQPPSQGGSQEQGGCYMLTPNAPALYGPVYGAFEKPPPYPC